MTIETSELQAVFVNTTQQPLSEHRLFLYVEYLNPTAVRVHEIVEVKYPHPETPDHAVITVIKSNVIEHELKSYDSKYPVMYILLMAQNAAQHVLNT